MPSKDISPPPSPETWDQLPGAELVGPGLEDLEAGRLDTVAAWAVSMAATSLRRLGLSVPPCADRDEPNWSLYEAVARDDPRSAFSRYRGILGRLASFLRSRDLQLRRASRPDPG